MVESYLEVYVIIISSAIILGTFYAATSSVQMTAAGLENQQWDNKINFYGQNVRINRSVNIVKKDVTETYSKSSEKSKLLRSSRVTPKFAKSSNNSAEMSEFHPYFALFDPVYNVTRKAPVSRQSEFSKISYKDFNDLLAESVNSKNFGQSSGNKSLSDGGKSKDREKIKNFIEWDAMRDSEKEVRILYNGITAKETIVRTGVDEDTGKRQGLKLRQLTDGTHFIQLIYNFDNEIQDCEYIKQKNVVEKFLKNFRYNVKNANRIFDKRRENGEVQDALGLTWEQKEEEEEEDNYLEDDEGGIEKYSPESDSEQYEGEDVSDFDEEYRNVTFKILQKNSDLPKEFAEWMNYSRLKRQCRQNHKILKRLAFNRRHGDERAKKLAEEHIERVKRSLDFSLIFPGTKWCGKSNIAEKYTALGGFSKTDKCCRTHDHCYPLVSAFEEKYGFYNFRPFTISHCRCDSRRKRDILDVLLVPGTKWCGKGRRATKYTSLGGFSRTDKCCRVHDTMCPYWIGSLEEKYGLFNWRINTIMHCRCDKRFRACLKMAKTGTANFVGKLFFNVVQTKCFVLKPQEVCLKYSWWGKCEKLEYRKKAYLKDNLSY